MKSSDLKIKIFADGADLDYIRTAPDSIAGFTTNPSLVRAAGIADYREFAKSAISAASGRPISFEVFADDESSMLAEAREIAGWGGNSYVKIPIVNTRGDSTVCVIRELLADGIKVNVTAVMTHAQIWSIREALRGTTSAIVSIFAGRIADTGRDAGTFIKSVLGCFWQHTNVEILWASTREIYSVAEANRIGCHIITVTPQLLKKLELFDKDLEAYSVETVRQFRADAVTSGLSVLPLLTA